MTGLLDLSAYKVTNNVSNVDGTTQNSMIDAIQAAVNALVDANIDPAAAISLSKLAGYPAAAGKYADGLGNWSVPDGSLIYRKTTTTDVVNTAVQTDITAGALVIPAGAIGANGIVHVTAWGDYLNNTGSTQTISLGLFFGANSNTPAGLAINPTTSATRVIWRVDWWINNQNAANAQQNNGVFSLISGAVAFVGGVLATDTTASVTVAVKATLGAANASLSARCHGAIAQVFAG